ncbi:MAG TPA: hemolysin III family protein [Tepidisphaeraceae bacterium]
MSRLSSNAAARTFDEEHVNAATHALGLAGALAGAAALLVSAWRHGGAWEIWGCALYATTLLATYAASTLSHVVRRPRPQHVCRTADQALIFLFIAGSWTSIAFAWLRNGPWWILHAAIWGVALFGFASKAVFCHRVNLGAVSAGLYLVLGWLPILAARPLTTALPVPLQAWLVAGGVCYTGGLIFFSLDHRIRYFHAAWHVLVLGGSGCHFLGILLYCTGAPL